MQTVRDFVEKDDINALKGQEEAIEVASQWAQEKVERFLQEIESNGDDHRLIKISHIIARRSSIDVFQGKENQIGAFAKDVVSAIADGNLMAGIGKVAESLMGKLFGSAMGSAQTERIYEVSFDELGGLNRMDAFFFCYRFMSSGITKISKAVIGTCIVRSAAVMVDDNVYRVILTSNATLDDTRRALIAKKMIDVARNRVPKVMDGEGKLVPGPDSAALSEARAELCQEIGEGVASSMESLERRQKRQGTKDGVLKDTIFPGKQPASQPIQASSVDPSKIISLPDLTSEDKESTTAAIIAKTVMEPQS